jgi:subtilisin family serine protease
MKRMLSISRLKCLLAGVAVVVVAAAVLFWPVTARSEAVTIEQKKERGKAVMGMPDPVGPPDRINVLVHVQPGIRRGPIRAFAVGAKGIVKYEYKTVLPNVINIRRLPVTAMAALEKIPGVVSVLEDKYHENLIKLDESAPLIGGLQSQIDGAGNSADGAGVRVCIADTGIDPDHVMYSDRIDTAAGRDFYNNDSNPEDDHGHGSHVAGIAVGGAGFTVDLNCEGSEPFQGIAPKATLIGVKILNANGGGYDSDIIAGIDYCANQSPEGGRADVINLSIGTGEYSGPCTHSWAVAANNAVDAGVVVVAASGNEGYSNALASPACGSKVIAVGATYKADYPRCENTQASFQWCLDGSCSNTCTDNSPYADDLVCFSNQSDSLDVVAPGSVILSASNTAGGSSLTQMSGTSMAAPHVAGLAALILSADPTLTPDEVRQIIRDGAIDMGPAGFDTGYGFGRIGVITSLSLITPCSVDEDCDDGSFCNGVETCDSGDCVPGTDPCPDETCDEDGDVCVTLVCDSDGICESGEDCINCPGDCISGGGAGGICGNGVCEPEDGEDCLSCAADCAGKQVGAAKRQYCCGDGAGANPVNCDDPRCTSEGLTCSDAPSNPYCCGDLSCEGNEDSFNCELDCGQPPLEPFCGDGFCDSDEDFCSCSGDCGEHPDSEETGLTCADKVDNDCDGDADCADSDCENEPHCNAANCQDITDRKQCNAESGCRWDNRIKTCVSN